MRKLKKTRGITLISLIITIVIMLILAVITLSFIKGKDGIVGKAGEASSKYKNAEEKEKDILVNGINSYLSIPVTGVSLNKSSTRIGVNNTEKLIATIEPSNATNKDLIWSSSNTDVVTVDENGIVEAVYSGTATITVTTVDGGYTATCEVSRILFCKGYKNYYGKWFN